MAKAIKRMKVVLRNSVVGIPWRTIYHADRIAKTSRRAQDTWQPEFLKKLPEQHVWAVATRAGYKMYTDREFTEQFEEVKNGC